MSGNLKAPRLAVPWTPWFRSFVENVRDLFRPDPPPLYLTSKPGKFWPDVFVDKRLPAAPFLQSFGGHATFIALVWVITFAFLGQPKVVDNSKQQPDKLTAYDVSEYLPPLSSGSAPAPQAKQGDPEYAKQPIVSLPPKPDNRMQTIVDPMNPKLLTHDIKLPNIVVWTPVPAAIPVVAALRGSALKMPNLAPEVVPPAPETQRSVAELTAPKLPAPSVIEPPPSPDVLQRKIGEINIGLAASVAQPKLVVPVQRAAAVGDANAKKDTQSEAPPSTTLGAGSGAQAMGQLIALGIHPVQPSGPIDLPGGNRSGTFAAGPNGHPGAAGTPDQACCGNGPGGTGSGAGGPGSGGGNPSGVFVGAGPTNPGAGVQGNHPANGAGTGPGGKDPNGGAKPNGNLKDLMAKAMGPPRLANIPRDSAPGSTLGPAGPTAPSDATKIDDYSFGPKKYYTMTINMPNLTSAGGSWIIRFAELNQTRSAAELTAPVAEQKVDPAYPPDLMKARVEGRVILYAVIHSDGTVGEVRVLQGLDDRLDENAKKAIARWHFRPATKNGAPIDLEAVVQIPFAVKKSPYGF
ncbi:MAG: energy transducer TonB [Acidobacteriota bacterium]|nr:energy transducer TonB [Acidobacteriota bacterium]